MPVVYGGDTTLQHGLDYFVVLVNIAHSPPKLWCNCHSAHDALTDAFVGNGDRGSDCHKPQQLLSGHGLPAFSVPHDFERSLLKDKCVEIEMTVPRS